MSIPIFKNHPKPLSALFLTEMWERFSFYSVRPLLILFMTAVMLDGGLGLDDATASAIYGIFGSMIYLTPVFGGYLADNWLGQERALWWGSIIIACGHLFIGASAFFGIALFFIGLVFLVLGTGLFKTCITVMIGALYDAGDGRRDAGFTLFYMGINLGALLAPLFTGIFISRNMWHAGFSVGGVGMLIALLFYRYVTQKRLNAFFNHTHFEKPKGYTPNPKLARMVMAFLGALIVLGILIYTDAIPFNAVFVAKALGYTIAAIVLGFFVISFAKKSIARPQKMRLLACLIMIVASTFFWAAFEQQPAALNLFAERYTDRNVLGFEIPTLWLQSLNPLLILLLAPVVSLFWQKLAAKNKYMTSFAKFAIGVFLAAVAMVFMALASYAVISSGQNASIGYLVLSIAFLTLGELFVSPVGLSSITKLAPASMQGVMMGLFFTSISQGALIASFAGTKLSPENLHDLPALFVAMTVLLIICGAVLLILSKPIAKMLKKYNIVL